VGLEEKTVNNNHYMRSGSGSEEGKKTECDDELADDFCVNGDGKGTRATWEGKRRRRRRKKHCAKKPTDTNSES